MNKKATSKEIQEALDKEFQGRVEGFKDEVSTLSQKYMLDIVPFIDYKSNGIVPKFGFVDKKAEYQHNVKEK